MVAVDGDQRHRGPEQQGPEQRGPRGRDPYCHDPAADVTAARAALGRTDTRLGPPVGWRDEPRRRRRLTPAERVRLFARRWGWRAYAIPLLAVITIVALMSSTSSHRSGVTASKNAVVAAGKPKQVPVAPPQFSLKADAPGANAVLAAPKGSALPKGAAFTSQGNGTFRVLSGSSPVVGKGTLYRYSIDVENGIDDIDLGQYQTMVQHVLSDPRSWSGHGIALKRVDSGQIDFHVTLTSSLTVRNLCGYSIPVETSCYAPRYSVDGLDVNRVVFNDARWVRGSTAYLGDVATYRTYMINHEDGHALGHEHAHQCLPGGLAPVMMQQTFGLRPVHGTRICQANPWPYPTGAGGKVVRGAPGAEQPDTPDNDEYGLGGAD